MPINLQADSRSRDTCVVLMTDLALRKILRRASLRQSRGLAIVNNVIAREVATAMREEPSSCESFIGEASRREWRNDVRNPAVTAIARLSFHLLVLKREKLGISRLLVESGSRCAHGGALGDSINDMVDGHLNGVRDTCRRGFWQVLGAAEPRMDAVEESVVISSRNDETF